MQAGKLRFVVTFEDYVPEQDSDGIVVGDGWVAAFGGRPFRASIEALSGRELIAAAAVNSEITTRIRMRWMAGVTARMRVKHRGEVYNIKAPLPDPHSRQQWLTLMCASGVNDG